MAKHWAPLQHISHVIFILRAHSSSPREIAQLVAHLIVYLNGRPHVQRTISTTSLPKPRWSHTLVNYTLDGLWYLTANAQHCNRGTPLVCLRPFFFFANLRMII